MKKTLWEKLTETEKQWLAEDGFTKKDLGEDVQIASNYFWIKYSQNGRVLAEMIAMGKRLKEED